jgi:adenylate kinase family enzyme
VIGNTGSGKTTFSRALAERLGVPHVELDALNWKSGWVIASDDEIRARVETVLAGEGWVIDGNYQGPLGTTVLDRADEVVWLDLPFPTTFCRLLRRTLRRLHTREQLWATTNRETFRSAFLSRDSVLWYLLRTYRRRRRSCSERIDGRAHAWLRSSGEIEQYLADAG